MNGDIPFIILMIFVFLGIWYGLIRPRMSGGRKGGSGGRKSKKRGYRIY